MMILNLKFGLDPVLKFVLAYGSIVVGFREFDVEVPSALAQTRSIQMPVSHTLSEINPLARSDRQKVPWARPR